MSDILKYFERETSTPRKRELSLDSSAAMEEAKKAKEDSISEDIYTESSKSPECMKILVKCFQGLENKVDNMIEYQKRSDVRYEEMKTFMNYMSTKIDEYERQRKEHVEKIKHLETGIVELKNINGSLELAVDDQQQRSRNNCLVLHGIPEIRDENTNELVIRTVREKLGVELKTTFT